MKPNIIVFMTDQQNASTISPNSLAKTPNIDKFLKNSVQFTEAYCPSPHCCPSRATFFSGLYPSEHGVWNNVEVDNASSRGLFDNITLFPELLSQNGYYNILSGKWHVSVQEGPLEKGFDEVLNDKPFVRMNKEYIPRTNEWNNIFKSPDKYDGSHEEKTDGRIIKEGYPHFYQYGINENPFGDNETVGSACKAIENYNKDKPLFMYVGPCGPHDPYFVPERFLDLYKDVDISLPESFNDTMEDKPALYRRTREQFNLTEEEHKESIRHYLAFASYEDYLFGQVIKAVEDKGIMDNTIIMYLTDHGDYCGAHGLWAKGLPCFKEAYNICAAIGGCGIVKNKKIDKLVSLADFAPTILDLASVEYHNHFTGKSLIDFLYENKENKDWRNYLFTQSNGNEIYGIQRCVFSKKWKYVFNSFDYDELYDLENDKNEIHNLCKKEEYKPLIKELWKELWKFAYNTKDACTCGYIMVRLAPYGPAIINENNE